MTLNPLVELTAYGVEPGLRVAVDFRASRGPGAIPARAGHRER
jgi:hypothetical protein